MVSPKLTGKLHAVQVDWSITNYIHISDDTDDDSDDSDIDDFSMDGDSSLDGFSGSDMDTDSDMESVTIPSFIVSAPSSPFPFPSPSGLLFLSRASSCLSFRSSPLASPCITAHDLRGTVDVANEPTSPSEEPSTTSTATASVGSAQLFLDPLNCVPASLVTLQPLIKDDVRVSYDDSSAVRASGVIVHIPSDTGAEVAPAVVPPVVPPIIAVGGYDPRRGLARSLSAASGKDTRGGAAPVHNRAPIAPTCNSTPPASQPTTLDLDLGSRSHRKPFAISTPSTPGVIGKKHNRDGEDDEAEATIRCRRPRLESADEFVPTAVDSSKGHPKAVTLRRTASTKWERCITHVKGSRTPGTSMGILDLRARLQRRPSALGPRRTMSGSL